MSWEETLATYTSASLSEYGAAYTRAMLPQLLNFGLEQGLSGREMLGQMRGAGFAIRNETFYNVLGEVRQAAEHGGTWAAADPASVPAATDFVDWSVSRGEGYQYRFEILMKDAGGDYSWLMRSSKVYAPVAPGELMQDWADLYSGAAMEEGGAYEGQTFSGMRLTGLYKLVSE